VKSFGPKAILAKALPNQKKHSLQKAFHGRSENTWGDKQREAQAVRKEALLQSKAFQAVCNRSDSTFRSALVALKERDCQSELVDRSSCLIIFDGMDPYFDSMINLLNGVSQFIRPKLEMILPFHRLDRDRNSDFFVLPHVNMPHLLLSQRPVVRREPLFLMSIAQRSLALDDGFRLNLSEIHSLVKHIVYEHKLAEYKMELEVSKSDDARYARVVLDETERYLLVDPNPEATRRYYDGLPQVEPRDAKIA
jgi:hypothetical protein